MASRSEKMYSDSPKMERDGESGKVGVKKHKREHKPKHDMGEAAGRHARELAEMHKRHLDEHKALNARQEKEAAAAEPPQGAPGAADPVAEPPAAA